MAIITGLESIDIVTKDIDEMEFLAADKENPKTIAVAVSFWVGQTDYLWCIEASQYGLLKDPEAWVEQIIQEKLELELDEDDLWDISSIRFLPENVAIPENSYETHLKEVIL